jgi:hypothetical protein
MAADTPLIVAPDGLEDDEVHDLPEPGDLLSPDEDVDPSERGKISCWQYEIHHNYFLNFY